MTHTNNTNDCDPTAPCTNDAECAVHRAKTEQAFRDTEKFHAKILQNYNDMHHMTMTAFHRLLVDGKHDDGIHNIEFFARCKHHQSDAFLTGFPHNQGHTHDFFAASIDSDDEPSECEVCECDRCGLARLHYIADYALDAADLDELPGKEY